MSLLTHHDESRYDRKKTEDARSAEQIGRAKNAQLGVARLNRGKH